MSLISCHDCDARISRNATSCPRCGSTTHIIRDAAHAAATAVLVIGAAAIIVSIFKAVFSGISTLWTNWQDHLEFVASEKERIAREEENRIYREKIDTEVKQIMKDKGCLEWEAKIHQREKEDPNLTSIIPDHDRQWFEDLYERAVGAIFENNRPYTNFLQTELGLNYHTAQAVLSRMEEEELVSKYGDGPRRLL